MSLPLDAIHGTNMPWPGAAETRRVPGSLERKRPQNAGNCATDLPPATAKRRSVRDENARPAPIAAGENRHVLRIGEFACASAVVRCRAVNLQLLEARNGLGNRGGQVPSNLRHRRLGKHQTKPLRIAVPSPTDATGGALNETRRRTGGYRSGHRHAQTVACRPAATSTTDRIPTPPSSLAHQPPAEPGAPTSRACRARESTRRRPPSVRPRSRAP